jgi:phospholipid/cholesterol/gamma-HCH transport system substrate-binding protein
MPAAVRSAILSRYGVFDYAFSAVIIAFAVAFLAFMQIRTGTGSLSSYNLVVQLADAGGLKTGSDVRLSGIKVGSVSGLSLGPLNRFALVHISVREDLALPMGSTFSITSGPMSDPYLSIKPGKGPGSIVHDSLVRQPIPVRPKPAPLVMRNPGGTRIARVDMRP